jgi:hypothetical protein
VSGRIHDIAKLAVRPFSMAATIQTGQSTLPAAAGLFGARGDRRDAAGGARAGETGETGVAAQAGFAFLIWIKESEEPSRL